MADSKSYKVNLITDVQDLIKGNHELRATSRYMDSVKRATEQFGRARYQGLIKVNTELKYMERHLANIYSLAVRVARLRVTPTVYLIDYATPALERLLQKLKKVSSYAVLARANFNMPILPATVMTKVDTTTTIEGWNMDAWIAALNTNTTAITGLTAKLDTLKLDGGGEKKEEPKGFLDSLVGFLGGGKSVGEGLKSVGETPEKWTEMAKTWKDLKTPGSKIAKIIKVVQTTGEFAETVFKAGEGLIGGSKSLLENGKGMFNSLVEGAGGMVKGLSKFLGPLSYAFDATRFATADNNEQRGSAIGSAIVGGAGTALGGALGSALPGVGTVVLGASLGVGGSILGDKLGGMIGKIFDSPNVPTQTTVTQSIKNGATIPPIDFSHVTGFPTSPPKMMLAPQPTFASRYVLPIVENYMKPKVEAMSRQNAANSPLLPAPLHVGKVPPAATITTKTSVQSVVKLSDTQMGTISGMLKDFKTELTNNISVNVPAGAVQVTVKENKIDYDLLASQVGQRIMVEVRKALENRKPPAQAIK
ncbi:hypothetical protein [Paenibacillus campi]|uniref:hypothetical protein n=1 Tax=Paenibacillus campi TaxID=3106031 RepID=UPI002AFF2E5D|nr:hypothetical protein [Paenibacillus sp. SGZ-1014]